jgi:hypothetical protein
MKRIVPRLINTAGLALAVAIYFGGLTTPAFAGGGGCTSNPCTADSMSGSGICGGDSSDCTCSGTEMGPGFCGNPGGDEPQDPPPGM